MSIDIRPRVCNDQLVGNMIVSSLTLRFAGLEEDVRDDLVDLTDEFEERIIGEVFQRELALSSVSRILRISELCSRQKSQARRG